MVYDVNGNQLSMTYDYQQFNVLKGYDVSGALKYDFSSTFLPNSFAVLGDSYSTYAGYTDKYDGYAGSAWYPAHGDLTSIQQTWWKLFESESELELVSNHSYSGSCICYDGYAAGTTDQTDISFIGRKDQVEYCEYIFIFGGTNDSWVPARIGEYKYSDWTESDKEYFRPALAYLINYYKFKYPLSNIVFIKNTNLGSEFSSSIDAICDHYGITEVVLSNITKENGHPTVTGMRQIATQIESTLNINA